MSKSESKYYLLSRFITITLICLLTRYFIFNGFNGTDDLHYARLASDMVKGRYSPFVAEDIFSGRILLVAWQALIYFIGGVNIFTTQAGTIIAIVLSCYFTVFRLLPVKNITTVIIASALFYFNPVLTEATIGVLPDIYILLAGIILLLLWRNVIKEKKRSKLFFKSFLIGVIIFVAMFFKENALIFFPFIICLAVIHRKQNGLIAGFISILTFSAGIILSAWMYAHYTGDVFFRVKQIESSTYFNPCSYEMLPLHDLIIRMTYGVWKEFIVNGFYPVLLASIILVLKFTFDKNLKLKEHQESVYFILLLLLSLYFPFSFKGYQPLCYKARHFLFLLPFAVSVCAIFLDKNLKNNRSLLLWIPASLILSVVCVISTPDKWRWMTCISLFIFFLLQNIFSPKLFNPFKLILFSLIFWLSISPGIFYRNNYWFGNTQQLSTILQGNYFYFPEHDNMMNWKLLHGFSDSCHTYNLEKEPFKIFQAYYESPDTSAFHPGWFIVNNVYSKSQSKFPEALKKMKETNFFSRQECYGNICAYYLDTKDQFKIIQNLLASD